MHLICLGFLAFCTLFLSACGDDPTEQSTSKPAQAVAEERTVEQTQKSVSSSQSAGGVSVKILPENPTKTSCLRAVIQGVPGNNVVIWKVNGEMVASGTDTQLCGDLYQRNDSVTVSVGTNDVGAQATVSIGNSLPRVVDISSTPSEIYVGTDITVTPVAEDADDDSVDFTYQWVINGEADPVLTEETLPGDKFTKGDTVQVQIVPNDFFDDGPTYESYAQTIQNASPQITSEPPQGIISLDYSYQVVVSDPDDTTFTFRLDESPEGMTIDENSGLIQWSLVDVSPGDYTIAIIAADSEGVETAQQYNLSLGEPQ